MAAVYTPCAWYCSGIELPPAVVLVFVVVLSVLAFLVIAGSNRKHRAKARTMGQVTLSTPRPKPAIDIRVAVDGMKDMDHIRDLARSMAPELERMAQAAEQCMRRDPVLELGRVLAVLLLDLHDLRAGAAQAGAQVTDHERIAQCEVDRLRACVAGLHRYEGAALDAAWARKLLDEHGMPHDDNLRRWRWVPTARRPAACC